MSNFFIGSNNLTDITFNGPIVFGGGSWQSALPLVNLQDTHLVNVAQSTDAATASTKFYFDMIVNRGMRHTFIPTHSCSRDANYRIRYSSTAAWSGFTVNALTSIGASSIVFKAGTTGGTITTGDIFTIAGDTTVYKATNTVVIAAAGTGTVNVTPNIAASEAATTVITCNTGDFTAPSRDSGTQQVYPPVFAPLTLSWLDPHQWDGKYTNEELATIKQPIVDYSSTPFFARYGLIEIFDSGNPAGYVWLSRLFVCLGYQATLNMVYGAKQGFTTTTKVNTSLGDAEFFEVRGNRRTFSFEVNDISVDEALSNSYELINFSGISNQVVFSFDPSDTINLPRRTILGRLQAMPDFSYAYYSTINTPYNIIEVIA